MNSDKIGTYEVLELVRQYYVFHSLRLSHCPNSAIGTAKLTRGRCFLFIDKIVGRNMGVAIFESFSFSIIIFFNLDNFGPYTMIFL